MRLSARLLLLVICAASFAGCSLPEKRMRVERFLAGHYDAVRQRDTEGILSMYGEQFFAATPREVWREKLSAVERELGPMQSFELRGWNLEALPNGDAYTFVYRVRYARQEAEEKLTVHQPPGGGALRIVGHLIHYDDPEDEPSQRPRRSS